VAKRPPTDFELLREIYEQHRDEYLDSPIPSPGLVPIDIAAIAKRLGVESVSVQARLFFDLNPGYMKASRGSL
jgi:hypothetical protein